MQLPVAPVARPEPISLTVSRPAPGAKIWHRLVPGNEKSVLVTFATPDA